MLINFSNHPLEKWSDNQKLEASTIFGRVLDLSFPEIDPLANIESIFYLATAYLNQCKTILSNGDLSPNAIHISGEPCFLFQFVTLAREEKIICVCSTTHRVVKNINNVKTSVFQFKQFRPYFKIPL